MATPGTVVNFDIDIVYPETNPANNDKRFLNPRGQPQYFYLARLIRYEDDAGGTFVPKDQANNYLPLGRDRPNFDLDDPNFNVSFGDLLLYVNPVDLREFQCMRNYEGREKLVPRRMLMPIHFPFSLPAFPLRTRGVPIDIAFARTALSVGTNSSHDWDDMTAFHVQRKYDEADNENNVIDLWGKRFSGIADTLIYRPSAIPWGVLVSRVDLDAYAAESERKTIDHIMNLPKFPRTDYRTNITLPQTGYPRVPFIFRERFIDNNPVLYSAPDKEIVRTGQQEIDYQKIHDDSGARPQDYKLTGACGTRTVQNLDPISPEEIDRNNRAKIVRDETLKAARIKARQEAAMAAADQMAANRAAMTKADQHAAASGKKFQLSYHSSGSDSSSDDGGQADEANDQVVEYVKWVPPEEDNDHFWPASDVYDGMNSDDWDPMNDDLADGDSQTSNPGGFEVKTDTPTDYA